MAKQLTSGYQPMSATVISESIYDALVRQSEKIGVFAHGFTYSGHPVAAAVGVETLKIYEERRIARPRALRSMPHFQRRLRQLGDHPLVGEARGLGLIGRCRTGPGQAIEEAFRCCGGGRCVGSGYGAGQWL